MVDVYVNEQGQKILNRLKRKGVLPSPYNFANYKTPSLDEYIIHDSTLREGEQTPGVVFSIEDKLNIAKKLDEVGIPQIEAGFPAASEKQRKCVDALVKLNLDAQLSAFARAKKEDIDVCIDANLKEIVIFMPISPIFRKTMKQKPEEQLEMIKIFIYNCFNNFFFTFRDCRKTNSN